MMHRLRGLVKRIDHIIRRDRFEQQVNDEMAFHLAMEAEHNRQLGLDDRTAVRTARLTFGSVDTHTEAMRSGRGAAFVEQIVRDVGYAMRSLRRTPAFSLAVLLTLVLGIGFNTFVFSLANSFLLRPLNVHEPDRLVRISTSESSRDPNGEVRYGASSYADYTDIARVPGMFDGVLAYMPASFAAEWRGQRVPAEGQFVSRNYFQLLGIEPDRGRLFSSAAGDEPTVVLGYSYWQRVYGADPSVVGDRIDLNGKSFTIAGIAPRTFTGIDVRMTSDIFVPIEWRTYLQHDDATLTGRGMRSVTVVGRLGRGATAASAQAALQPLMTQLGRDYPDTNAGRTVALTPAGTLLNDPQERRMVATIATGILIVTFLVLAIGCLNIASLMLARALSRRREIAIRLSLGASRRRIMMQFLVESEVLAVTSGVAAIGLLALLTRLLAGTRLGGRTSMDIDGNVLLFALALSAITGIVFGLAPAVRMTRSNVRNALQQGQSSPESVRLTNLLVGAQLTLSMVLLVIAVSLIASVRSQQRTDPGFAAQGLAVTQPTAMLSAYSDSSAAAFMSELADRMRRLPGIEAVAFGTNVPLTSEGYRSSASLPATQGDARINVEIAANHVGPDYFRALGIPLLRGREIDVAQGASAKGIVITRRMAEQYWPDRDPLGQVIRLGDDRGEPYEIIAVAGDVHFRSLNEPPRPMMFIQDLQRTGHTLHVRTSGDVAYAIQTMRREAESLDADIMLYRISSMEDVLRAALTTQSVVALGLTLFALLAATLASVGLYGLLVFGVLQRRVELGVRMALGATSGALRRGLLGRAGRIVAASVVAGLLLSLASTALIARVAPGTFRFTGVVFVLSAGLLAVVALTASVTSTRSLRRISPMSVMRNG